jgi:serine/threonine protein kinase
MLTPERHKLIGDLCYAALEMEEPQRAAFLDQACAGDEDMRREVELMLAQETRAESFLESPVLDVAAKALAHNLNEAPSHRSVGRYQILSLIGAGGMGEVYRARDPRLRREVAIKVLPAALAGEGERMRRFHQESLVVSALNHPNIVTIYELGEADGQHFMVMEYVAGQTLRQRLAERLSLSESLEIGAQVASALQAAHAAGVIHRDIKPENVMIRPDGLVKVLDFGLAKLTGQPAEVETDSAAPTMMRTEAGTILGTVSYMSPEQARGQVVDARTDIFSLGVMLYELVAGRRPFEGATQIDTLAAILHLEPTPLTRHAPGAPAELDRIVSKALQKDRDARYQTTQALLADLQTLKQQLETPIRQGSESVPDLPNADLPQGSAEQNKRRLFTPALAAFIALVEPFRNFPPCSLNGKIGI